MTVALNQAPVLEYIGNNTASVFPITFPTFEIENVEAEVYGDGITTTLVLDTDFTLANIGKVGTNGSFTLVSAGQVWLQAGKLKTGYSLFIKFNASPSQPLKGRDWGNFSPEKFERTLDRLAMSIKAVKSIADKAIGLQLGDGAQVKLPSLAGNGGKIMQVKPDETGFEYGVTSAQIQDWRNETSDFRNETEDFRDEAEAFAQDATDAETGALAAQAAAASSATSAFNSATNAANSATGAATSQANAVQAVTDAAAEKNAAVIAKNQAETARDAAIAAANDTSIVGTYKIQTEAARDLALGYRNDAQTAKTAAELAEANAELAEINAESAATDAVDAMTFADIFAADAQESKEQAELFANLSTFSKKLVITFADSPFTVDDDLHQDTLIIVDDSLGNVVVNMPPVSDTNDQPTWKVGFMKKAANGNHFNVNRSGLDTIGGLTTIQVDDQYLGLLVYPGSPTNWTTKFFVYAVAADGFVLSGAALTFGDPGVDGSWRLSVVAGQFKIQNRQLGVWVDSDVMNPPA